MWRGQRHGNGTASEQGLNGVARIGRFHRLVFHEARIIETARVAQAALLVENEDMRRGQATIGASDILRFTIVEIGKVPAIAGGVRLHVGERVAVLSIAEFIQTVAIRVIGIDGHEREAACPQVIAETLESFLDAMGGGTVIGREEHHEDVRSGKVG